MRNKIITHKSPTENYYKSIPIHTAVGVHEFVANMLAEFLSAGSTVLELGAGSGALTSRLLDMGYNVTPVDLDNKSWMVPGKSVIEQNLNKNNWDSIPLKIYDCVVAVEVIEHLENPSHFIRKITQYLGDNTKLILTTPNILCGDSFLQLIKNGGFYGFSEDQFYLSGHRTLIPFWLLKCIGSECNLNLENVYYIGKIKKRFFARFATNIMNIIARRLVKGEYIDDGNIMIFKYSK